MNLFFSINCGPFIRVFQAQVTSTSTDDAWRNLIESNKPCLGDTDALGHTDYEIRRIIAHDTDVQLDDDTLTDNEIDWLHVSSARWDVPQPDTAIYDIIRDRSLPVTKDSPRKLPPFKV